jgi:hypothetical protein
MPSFFKAQDRCLGRFLFGRHKRKLRASTTEHSKNNPRYERVMLVRCTRYHALQSPCILHLDKQQWTMAASKEPKGHPKPNGHPKDGRKTKTSIGRATKRRPGLDVRGRNQP